MTATAAPGTRFHRHWDPSRDRDMSSVYQRAREQFIATWGFAPGQQTEPLPGSFPVSRWTPIGPFRTSTVGPIASYMNVSGRINSIALHPTDLNTVYVGAADGGVWKTSDGGSGWLPLTDGQCSLEIGAVVVDPVSPNIVYAGTGDPRLAQVSDEPGGCGLLRSTDGGANWTVIAGTASFGTRVEKLVIDPTTAGSSTATKIFAATGDKGLLRSTDSGSTWTPVLSGGDASDVVIDPSNAQTVFAAIGNAFCCSTTNGIYKSTDGGATFLTKLAGGFPTASVGVIKFDIARSAPSTLFAAVQSQTNDSLLGIFKSTNSGATWSQVAASGAFGGRQLDYDITLNVDPANANTVYFGASVLYKSIDGGASFNVLSDFSGPIHPDFHAFVFQPSNSNTIYVGNDGGIYKSTDGGSSWTSLNSDLPLTQMYPGGALHPSDLNIILAGTQDNGIVKYSGFATWDEVRIGPSGTFLCGDGGFTAIDQSTPTTFYAACFGEGAAINGPIVYRSDDGGSTWTAKTNGINANDAAANSPLVMSPSNSQTLYYGTNKVYKTTDRGESWTASGTIFQGGVLVTAIAPAASNTNVIYIIVDLGPTGLFKSTDGNASYTAVNSSSLPAGFVPSSLAVHPTDANTVFVGYKKSSFTPGVLKSTDGGTTWTDITGNLPADVPINAIALDPSAPTSKILVATHLGVFGTVDGGATWTPNGVNLPNVIVIDLKYHPATAELVAFTYGRGAWKATLNVAVTHDFNGDGNSDIAWRQTGGATALWLMSGAQISQAGVFGVVPTSWSIVGQRDFDGDGKHDLLWRDSSTNTVAIWLLNGLQILGSGALAQVPSNWVIADTGDFNGDLKGDILWRESSSGSVALWLLDGIKILQTASLGSVPSNWVIAGTGDFDGDGSRDILWRDSNTGTVAIWFLDRRQRIIQSGSLSAVPGNWAIVGTGDFDGDGISDILWRDSNTGTAAICLLNGLKISQSGSLGAVPSEFIVAETGDFNGDGKSDVLWRQTTKGAVVIWFMNGLKVLQTTNLGGVSLDWTIQGLNAD
jgi:hypothetical protein